MLSKPPNWLRAYYALNSSEVATLLAVFMRYDVADVVDPQAHVIAKIRKDALAQIPKPATPAAVFCQPRWGCAPN